MEEDKLKLLYEDVEYRSENEDGVIVRLLYVVLVVIFRFVEYEAE